MGFCVSLPVVPFREWQVDGARCGGTVFFSVSSIAGTELPLPPLRWMLPALHPLTPAPPRSMADRAPLPCVLRDSEVRAVDISRRCVGGPVRWGGWGYLREGGIDGFQHLLPHRSDSFLRSARVPPSLWCLRSCAAPTWSRAAEAKLIYARIGPSSVSWVRTMSAGDSEMAAAGLAWRAHGRRSLFLRRRGGRACVVLRCLFPILTTRSLYKNIHRS